MVGLKYKYKFAGTIHANIMIALFHIFTYFKGNMTTFQKHAASLKNQPSVTYITELQFGGFVTNRQD